MEDFLGNCLVWILLSIGISLGVKIINTLNKKRLLAKMPSEDKLVQYVKSLHIMRDQGASFHDQLNFLLRAGVDQKIAEVIIANLEKEKK